MDNAIQLDWDVAGARQIGARFTRLAIVLKDFSRPLARIAKDVIYPETKHQFEAEGDPPWDPLQAAYARWKERHYPGQPKLQRTGALMASLTGRRAPGSIYRLSKLELVIGTGLRTPDGKWNLGLIHQLGAPNVGTNGVPPRPMMRLRAAAQTRAIQIFSTWLWEQGRRHEVGL